MAQGWLLGMPMAEADLIELVANQHHGPTPADPTRGGGRGDDGDAGPPAG